jgi:hypothetical protein
LRLFCPPARFYAHARKTQVGGRSGPPGERAPLRRFKARAGSQPVSPPARLPLMRFAAFQSVVSNRLAGSLVPCSRLAPRRFRRAPCGFYRLPSPACLRKRVHPLVSFTPLQSSPIPCLPRVSRRGAPSRGFTFPLRDISQRHRYGAIPLAPPSVLGVSHAPDGLLRLWPCRFISPCSHVQGSPSRRSNSHSRADSSPSRALSSLAKVRCTGCPMRHVPSPRPQGFAPCESSGVLATVFSRRLDPPPRGSLLLQVFLLAAVRAPSRPFRSWPSSRVRRSRPRY